MSTERWQFESALKVMKKKLRKILISGKMYFWSIAHPNCDGDGHCLLRIYHNKNLIYKELVGDNITPKYIRQVIEEL